MMLTKVKLAGALLLVVTLIGGGGAGWFTFRAPAAEALRETQAGKEDKSNDDKDAIQGAWQVTGVEEGGKEKPDAEGAKEMKAAKWVFSADQIAVSIPKQGEHKVTYKLDPTKKPKQIDFTPLDGPPNEKGKTGHGIYSLDGDVLKLCMPGTPDADERPTELRTKEGGKAMLITLKREKPAKDKPKEGKPEADNQAIQGVWQVTDVETNDKKTPGLAGVLPTIKTQQWVFAADKITVRMPGEKAIPPTAYTLDPSKTPKEIDITPQKGNDLQSGAYSLEGDVLKLCVAGPNGGPRPTELAADEAGKYILLTFKRVSAAQDKPKEDKPKDDAKVKKLLEDLYQAANEEYRMRKQQYAAGTITLEELAGSARRVMTAELERSEKKEDRVKASEEYLQQVTEVVKIAKIKLAAGKIYAADVAQTEYYRLEAEIMLEREKAK